MLIRSILTGLLVFTAVVPAWGQNSGETELIATLESAAPAAEKDAACKRLKLIGTAASVPALEACLNDDALSHPARQALESMECPEAGAALLDALSKTDGHNRLGVIDSLGMRKEERAVPALVELLNTTDASTSAAAARALGNIGIIDVVDPLKAALRNRNPEAFDGLLRCAGQLEPPQAFNLADYLYNQNLPEHQRAAAYRAMILNAGDDALDLTLAGITGDDRAARVASLGVAAQIGGEDATLALADTAAKLDAPVQAALIRALGDRGDSVALPAIAEALKSEDGAVRLAAVRALGQLGGGREVATLLEFAANAEDAERDAARFATASLRGPNVDEVVKRGLEDAPADVRAELIAALAIRRDPAFAPGLIAFAKQAPEPLQLEAIKALGVSANASHTGALIDLMWQADSEPARDAAASALVRTANRTGEPEGVVDALLGVRPVSVATLTAAAQIDFQQARPALQKAIESADAQLRRGAVRAFAQYCGPESASEVLALASVAADETERTLVMRGYWRLINLAADRPPEARLQMVRHGLEIGKSVESKKSGLATLADIPLEGALSTAREACADDAVRPEAELAVYTIASRLVFAAPDAAQDALRDLAANALDERLREKAAKVAQNASGANGFVVPWLVSKPYRVEGKEAQDLFDVAFPPEQGGGAEWRLQPPAADPDSLWYVDLTSAVGGNHCVIYLKTRVYSENGGPVTAEIGSDDGFKLWVNGELAGANNAVRGFAPKQDKAEVELKPGWNDFLVKVTQHTAGCALAVRLPGQEIRVATE